MDELVPWLHLKMPCRVIVDDIRSPDRLCGADSTANARRANPSGVDLGA